jgi:glycosyltransferase involved in cell wall biosynthesis
MAIKVLMYGWEFPPFNSGGLGVACLGLTEKLVDSGVQVNFVLPKKVDIQFEGVNFLFADQQTILNSQQITDFYSGYHTFYSYQKILQKVNSKTLNLGKSLYDEVIRYAQLSERFATSIDFDVIHCHDWLTILAGIKTKQISGKTLIMHVHATEYERTCGSCNSVIYEIEKYGMEQSDKVVAVSAITKQIIVEKYGIDPEKVEVVHNGIDVEKEKQKLISGSFENLNKLKASGQKIVLFIGRLTFQKGVEYLLLAIKKALEFDSKILFVISGSGDMEHYLIEQVAVLRISDKVVFTGFLRGNELASIYKLADLYVMPSRYEPFGLVALEALVHQTPIIISKNSGVGEVISNCLKVDYWDTEEMANLIVNVLNYKSLHQTLQSLGHQEAYRVTWREAARKLLNLYQMILEG